MALFPVCKRAMKTRPPRRSRLVYAIFMMVVALSLAWTGIWQGDRRAAAASAEVHGIQAHLKSTTEHLDVAVLEAYVHGDIDAQSLLPKDQWVACSERATPMCAIETTSSTSGRSRTRELLRPDWNAFPLYEEGIYVVAGPLPQSS